MAAGDSHTPARTDLALVRESDRGTLAEPTWSGVTSFMRRRYRKALDGNVADWLDGPAIKPVFRTVN